MSVKYRAAVMDSACDKLTAVRSERVQWTARHDQECCNVISPATDRQTDRQQTFSCCYSSPL